MGKIFVTSDTHFGHSRAFIYEPRGFHSVEEMDNAIIQRWNEVVSNEDEIYHLGDVMLNDNDHGLKCLQQLNGKIHLVCGNHDSNNRRALYTTCSNVIEVVDALRLNYKGYHFFMTHYPCFTGNLEKESLKQCTCNLFGHTHQKTNFYQDIPFMYHVGVDSHNCTPVLLDDIIKEMNDKVQECLAQL